jgi:glycerol-3-phosphate cytidylyltransferase-like family protein
MINIISGEVIKWKNIWSELWYKTANIKLENKDIEYWVYKINIIIDNIIYHWAWVYIEWTWVFESHIFDFNRDIYWKNIEVIILKKIRKNKKFKLLEDLKEQIKNDIKKIKKIEFRVLTFWTFDILHPWHEYYLKNAKKYSDKLITIIWTDKNVEKIKWRLPINNQNIRKTNLKNLDISNIVLVWDEKYPFKIIKKYKPQVICLWYDQRWFSEELSNFIINNNLSMEVIRLKSYKENIYKSSLISKKNMYIWLL